MKTPPSERRRLVARWRASHPRTMTDFARSIGVPQSTFWRWAQDYPEDSSATDLSSAFIELSTVDPVAVSPLEEHPEPLSLRLEGTGGVNALLCFDVAPSPTWLAQVLRGVLAC